MGTLRDGVMKRGSTWSFVIRVTDERTGVSKPKWAGGFPTEAAAKEARDSARVAARQGVYVDRSRITVTQYLEDWLDAHALEIKPATLSTYRYLVTHYVTAHIGRMRLQAVRPTTLSGLYRDLLVHGGKEGRPLSRATVDYVQAILRKAFNDAVRSEQLLVTNPAERAKRPRGGPRGLREVWTAEQLRTFLNAASHHRLSAFFRVPAYTGARRGEVSNLRWADIDWAAPALRIKGSVGIIAGQRVEGTTKSGRERLVSLDLGTIDVLRDLRRKQVENQLALGDAWTETGHVFTSGDGVPINPDSMTALMAKTIRAYNAALPPDVPALPLARLHDLRHVHATHLLLAGVPVHVVADRLGHADPAITLRVYAHVLRQHAAGVADVFTAAIEPGHDATPAAANNGDADPGAEPGPAALLAEPLASPDHEPENPRSLSL
jgi:integrase